MSALEGAYADGVLSEVSRDALLGVPRIGGEIARSLGDGAGGDELLLVTMLVDDSASIGERAGEVRRGHDLMLKALSGGGETRVLVHTRLLNGGVLSPYEPLARATALTERNYATRGAATPLYLQSVIALASVIATAREEEAAGRRVRTFTLLITDGEDNNSGATTVESVRFLITDMLEFATNHIVAGMGIGDERRFGEIFRSLGIPGRWIFTPRSSTEEIAEIFKTLADSLVLAASSEAAFLALSAGPAERSD